MQRLKLSKMILKKYISRKIASLLGFLLLVTITPAVCQTPKMYPPFTKWYQDPLGLKPIELSTAFGFVWGSAAVATCLILTKNDSLFQNRVSAYSEEGFSAGYKHPYTIALHHETGLMYDVRKWMALGIGGTVFHFKDKINNTWTFGFMPFARWYVYKSGKISFYIHYGAGLSYSLNRFPLTGTGWESDTGRTGTKFNFLSKYGFGAECYLTKRLVLFASIKHFHLSNGNTSGIQRNPSHDSNGFFLGISYPIRKKST